MTYADIAIKRLFELCETFSRVQGTQNLSRVMRVNSKGDKEEAVAK
jgi:hypothetical protein